MKLVGLKEIVKHERQSERIIKIWIRDHHYPAVKFGRGYEVDAGMAKIWRRWWICKQLGYDVPDRPEY